MGKSTPEKNPLLGPPRLLSLYLSASLALLLLHRTVIESTDTDTELRHTTHTHSDRKEAEEGERAQGKRKRRKKNSPLHDDGGGQERNCQAPEEKEGREAHSLPLFCLRLPFFLALEVVVEGERFFQAEAAPPPLSSNAGGGAPPHTLLASLSTYDWPERSQGKRRRRAAEISSLRSSNKYCCGRTKTLGLFGTFHGSDCLGEAVVGKFQLPLGQCCICYSTKSYMCGINGVGIHIYHRMHGEGKKREERTAVAEERNRQSQNRKTTCALWSRPAMRRRQQ